MTMKALPAFLTYLSLCLTVLSVPLKAQQKSPFTVQGVVTDTNGEPVAGVSVVCFANKAGVITDNKGAYKITASSKSATLNFSFLGMKTQTLSIDGRAVINIEMQDDAETLENAIIVGAYGMAQRREDLVGSAFQVNSEALKSKPVTRVDNLLEGIIPGLSINPNTDDASSTRTRFQTRIRGDASLSASNEPLWVIDGVVQYTGTATGIIPGMSTAVSPLSYLDPSDIESITVLKDADQVAIYGANGANGVVLVTTKSGQANSPLRVDATVKYGIATIDHTTLFKMMNASQYMEVAKEAWLNAGNKISDFPYQDNEYNSYSTTATDWPSQYLGIGNNIYAQIGLRGGSNKIATSTSASYYREEGTVKTDTQQRFTLRLKNTFNFTKNFSIGVALNGSYNVNNLFPVSASAYLYQLPIFTPYLNDGTTYRLYNKVWDATKGDFAMKQFTSNYLPDRQYNDNKQRSVVTKANFDLKWTIIPGLTLSSVFGFDYTSSREETYSARKTIRGMDHDTPQGSSSRSNAQYLTWTNSNLLQFSKLFAGKHKIDAYVGLELNSQSNKYSSISGYGFTNDHIKEIAYADKVSEYSSTSIDDKRTLSYFGRLMYSYDSRYIISANIRRDGSSIFGEYSKWGTFWSVGASWNIHKEHFFNIPWISVLKLKASFGKSGNSRIDITTATGTYQYSNSYSYLTHSGAVIGSVPNPGLSWETTYQTNIGLRCEFAKNVDIEVEFYDNNTSDLLSKVYVSRTISDDRLYANMGCMNNIGVELNINADIIHKHDFNWYLSLNAAHNRNTITKLYDGRPTSFGSTIWMEGHSSDTHMLIRWAGVDPSDGAPMWYDLDGNITKRYDYGNRVPGKEGTPILFGGLTNNLRWKQFSLSLQLNYTIGGWANSTYAKRLMADGNDIISENQAVEVYYYRWTTPGQKAIFPKVSNKTQWSTSYNDRFLISKTNFRLSNLTFSYDVPGKICDKIKMRGLTVSFICDNVYLFTPGMSRKFNSYKTEMNGYPVTRTYSLSLNASF